MACGQHGDVVARGNGRRYYVAPQYRARVAKQHVAHLLVSSQHVAVQKLSIIAHIKSIISGK